MIVVSWNVNSVRMRLPRVGALLARHPPDVLWLQELKVGYDQFPAEQIAGCGCTSAVFAQAGGGALRRRAGRPRRAQAELRSGRTE